MREFEGTVSETGVTLRTFASCPGTLLGTYRLPDWQISLRIRWTHVIDSLGIQPDFKSE
jgi:hypothetical protein